MFSEFLKLVFQAIRQLFATPSDVRYARLVAATAPNLSEDQIRALIWAEQAGMLTYRAANLPVYRQFKQFML